MDINLWQGLFLYHSPALFKRHPSHAAKLAIEKREEALTHFEELAWRAVGLTAIDGATPQGIPEWPSCGRMSERWLESVYASGIAMFGTLNNRGAIAVARLPASVFGASEEHLRTLAAQSPRQERSRRLRDLAEEFRTAAHRFPELEHIAIQPTDQPAQYPDFWPKVPCSSGDSIGFPEAVWQAVLGRAARETLGQHVAMVSWLRFLPHMETPIADADERRLPVEDSIPKKRWTQEEVGQKIHELRSQHATLLQKAGDGDEESHKKASSLFGRNSLCRMIGCSSAAVSKSPAYIEVKAKLNTSHRLGKRVGLDVAMEESALSVSNGAGGPSEEAAKHEILQKLHVAKNKAQVEGEDDDHIAIRKQYAEAYDALITQVETGGMSPNQAEDCLLQISDQERDARAIKTYGPKSGRP